MASWIQLPDGYTFALENIKSVSADLGGLLLEALDGSRYLWPATDPGFAANLVAAIQVVMKTPASFTPIGAQITSVAFSVADITLATSLVKGFGFFPGNIGLLRIEDATGGPDSNGYFHILTYVDYNTMTGVYGGPGDGQLGGGGVLIYYQTAPGTGTAGAQSNAIAGTNTSGTDVTIP